MGHEHARVDVADDGVVRVAVRRVSADGVIYRAELCVQRADAMTLADALDAFDGFGSQEYALTDGSLAVFGQYRSEMCNLELTRIEGHPHGRYATLSLEPKSLSALIATLRTLS